MSLILEALKKAERQHRLGEVPGIGSSQAVKNTSRSHGFILILLILLSLVMLVLGLYLGGGGFQDDEADQTVATPDQVLSDPPQPGPMSGEATQEFSSLPEPDHFEDAHTQSVDASADEKRSETAESVVMHTPADTNIQRVPPPPSPPPTPKMLNELPDGFVDNLPQLNIDIHSYDSQASRRYVLINLEKYREGDYLAEGPYLSEILVDGVILEHMGERFILPIGNF